MISSAIAEGINFRNVRFVHIMEPYWNYSRLKQIIARATRNNSHKDLDEAERTVQPYIYISTIKGMGSVDEHLYDVSIKKEKFIMLISNELKKISINCMH
jgi:hypothetical protein